MIKQGTKEKYVGKVFSTKASGDIVVVQVLDSGKCVVKFLSSGNLKEALIGNVVRGEVRDSKVYNVNKVGIMDIKRYLTKGEPVPKDYSVWNGIMQRCFNENVSHLVPCYKDVNVSEDFKIFSKFKKWYSNQIGAENTDWQVDKDLLSNPIYKVYSEDTCVLLPPEINSAITNNAKVRGGLPVGVTYNCTKTRYRSRVQKPTGWTSLGTYDTPEEAFFAYKEAKEKYIKELANKWKDQIDPRAYDALLKWEVNIDD